MTLVTIDLGDVAGGHHPDDHVVIRAENFRESPGGGITSTAEVTIPLVDGVGQTEVEPGPVVVAFRCQAVADTREKRGVVPDEGPASIEQVIYDDFTYSPTVVSESVATIRGAVDKAIAPYVIQVDHEKELAQDAAATSIAHAVLAGDAAQGAYVSKDLSQDAAAVSVTHAVLAGEVISEALLTAQDDVIRIAVDGTGDMVDAVMSPYVDAVRHEKELAQDAGAVVATGLAIMQDLVNQMNNNQ